MVHATQKARLLLIEPHVGSRKNIEALLEGLGFEVASASNAEHGWVLARSMLPDVVICDGRIAHAQRWAWIRALRSEALLAHTRIVLLADHAPTHFDSSQHSWYRFLSQQLRLQSIDAVFDKPLNPSSIAQALNQVLALPPSQLPLACSLGVDAVNLLERYRHNSTASQWMGTQSEKSETSEHIGSILWLSLTSLHEISERLDEAEVAQLLREIYAALCQSLHRGGASHVQLLGEHILALFEETSTHDQVSQAEHPGQIQARLATGAACRIHHAWPALSESLTKDFFNRALPSLNLSLGLHSGAWQCTLAQEELTASPFFSGIDLDIAQQMAQLAQPKSPRFLISMDSVQWVGQSIKHDAAKWLELPSQYGQQRLAVCQVLTTANLDHSLDLTNTYEGSLEPKKIIHLASQHALAVSWALKTAFNESLSKLYHSRADKETSLQSLRFKGYQILRKLGVGGMSDVYLALGRQQKQELVLKILHTPAQQSSEMLHRFIQEYAVLSRLKHPHVARIYDQGFTDEFAYIAMEHLPGGTLKEAIRERHQSDALLGGEPRSMHSMIIRLLKQIASALGAIHAIGLIYRDLKPENLMFKRTPKASMSSQADLVLVDFGIVKFVRPENEDSILDAAIDESTLATTAHGQVLGTPYYVSPEQASGLEITPASDFYSLGVLLFELLTGSRPYRGDSLNELIAKHLQAPLPVLPTAHAIFQPLIDQLMSKQPLDRPQNSAELIRALSELENQLRSA